MDVLQREPGVEGQRREDRSLGGCVVAFEESVSYAVERVGALNTQTAMTALFGGEGLSLATLSGDGTVILQSMTMDGLAKALRKNMGIGDDKKGPLGGLLSGSVE